MAAHGAAAGAGGAEATARGGMFQVASPSALHRLPRSPPGPPVKSSPAVSEVSPPRQPSRSPPTHATVSERMVDYAARLSSSSDEHILHLQLLRQLAQLDVKQENDMRQMDLSLVKAVREFEASTPPPRVNDGLPTVDLISEDPDLERARISRLVSHLHQTVEKEVEDLRQRAAAIRAEPHLHCDVDEIINNSAVKRREFARGRVAFVLERYCKTLDRAIELMDAAGGQHQPSGLRQLQRIAEVAETMHSQSSLDTTEVFKLEYNRSRSGIIDQPGGDILPGVMDALSQVVRLAARACEGHNRRHENRKWSTLQKLAKGMLTKRRQLIAAFHSDRDIFIDWRRAAGRQLELVKHSETCFLELVKGDGDRPSLLSTLKEEYARTRPKRRDYIIKKSDYEKMNALAEFDEQWGGAGDDPELVQFKHERDELKAVLKRLDDIVRPSLPIAVARKDTTSQSLLQFCSTLTQTLSGAAGTKEV
jgi:hypothetical protein